MKKNSYEVSKHTYTNIQLQSIFIATLYWYAAFHIYVWIGSLCVRFDWPTFDFLYAYFILFVSFAECVHLVHFFLFFISASVFLSLLFSIFLCMAIWFSNQDPWRRLCIFLFLIYLYFNIQIYFRCRLYFPHFMMIFNNFLLEISYADQIFIELKLINKQNLSIHMFICW